MFENVTKINCKIFLISKIQPFWGCSLVVTRLINTLRNQGLIPGWIKRSFLITFLLWFWLKRVSSGSFYRASLAIVRILRKAVGPSGLWTRCLVEVKLSYYSTVLLLVYRVNLNGIQIKRGLVIKQK